MTRIVYCSSYLAFLFVVFWTFNIFLRTAQQAKYMFKVNNNDILSPEYVKNVSGGTVKEQCPSRVFIW